MFRINNPENSSVEKETEKKTDERLQEPYTPLKLESH
jgi:hypothetical protein